MLANDRADSTLEGLAEIDTYVSGVTQALEELSREQIWRVVQLLYGCWLRGASVYLIGNGGSAATASHMMTDLVRYTRVDGKAPLRAIALTDNVPLMTAISNDSEYERIFSDPLEVLLKPDDVVIAVSTSGNSPNIIRAVTAAKHRGASVVGLCGSGPNKLSAISDVAIEVPAKFVGQQEDGHLVVNHAIVLSLRRRIEGLPSSNGGAEKSGVQQHPAVDE